MISQKESEILAGIIYQGIINTYVLAVAHAQHGLISTEYLDALVNYEDSKVLAEKYLTSLTATD